mmetsp:Transcript_31466/g.66182  ORF Transcript_31466/g.66182 Transcript_31466/m.66182 type:complete len:946 (+) Transcript_31466:135-2972(+)
MVDEVITMMSDDDDDDDLQAAIALSMQQQQNNNSSNEEEKPDDDHGDDKPVAAMKRNIATAEVENNDEQKNKSLAETTTTTTTTTSEASFDCQSFHKLMWDDATTTTNDKERWIYECISTPFLQEQMGGNDTNPSSSLAASPTLLLSSPSSPPSSSSSMATAATAAASSDGSANKEDHDDDIDLNPSTMKLTPLEVLTGSRTISKHHSDSNHKQNNHKPPTPPPQQLWGLTQKHGGPCGILAAIQAEMIRILLFGRKGGGEGLYFPFCPLSNANNYKETEEVSPITYCEVKEAMAMAIGMILARAAFAPCAASSPFLSNNVDSSPLSHVTNSVQLVLPDSDTSSTTTMSWIQEMLSNGSPSSSLSLLESSSTTTAATSNPSSSGLKVHSISITHDNNGDSATTAATAAAAAAAAMANNDKNNEASPEMKRPRSGSNSINNKGVSFSFDNNESNTTTPLSPEQTKLTAMATCVKNFLLAEEEGGGENNNNSKRQKQPLELFQGPRGVMYLVMSLVETRGIDRIRQDMDDPNTTITSQFGHSSQELMNLLLTGQAVSNVFDNSMTLSEELTCHGIQYRPAIGYLTMLESLRYCEVGGYYKSPLFPIWVVGSTSHFSVLFGDERCLQESKSDVLLEKCRRAFRKVEGGDENGFILVDKLGEVLDELDLKTKVGGDSGVQTLKAYLEVSGAGIILWDDFWKASSRLMTGSSLEAVMSRRDDLMQVDIDNNDGPPMLITQFGEENNTSTTTPSAPQSDEELAKKLAAEWGSMPDQAVVAQGTKSDEDYARELQAQWDAEMAGADDVIDVTSQMATTDDVASLSSVSERPPTPPPDAKMEAEKGPDTSESGAANNDEMTDNQTQSHTQQLDFEKHGLSFPLYHYNGLRGGTLTHSRLTRLSPTEAVGASIALSSKGGSGHGAGGGDLEDLIRTKWPSSMLNWFGKNPPSID